MTNTSLAKTIVAVLAVAPLGCSSDVLSGPQRQPVVEAQILRFDVMESCPPVVIVVALVGTGACDTLLEPRIRRTGNDVRIDIEVETSDRPCAAMLVGSEVRVNIGRDYEEGDLRVTIPSRSSRTGDATFSFPPRCIPD